MKTIDPLSAVPAGSVWEDLVTDFLEMACFLTPEEQDFLLDELRQRPTSADSIEVFPSFRIDGRIVVVCERLPSEGGPSGAIRECWLYYPREKKIKKHFPAERQE